MSEVRRAHKRAQIRKDLDMSFRRLISSDFQEIDSAADVSFGGMKFFAPQKVPIGEDIDVRINFKNSVIRYIGNVKRCQKTENGLYEFGIEFVTISGKNLYRLKHIIEDAEPSSSSQE